VKDFTEFAVGPLRVPINGRLWELPPIDIATGLLLRRAVTDQDAAAIEELAGTDDESAYRRVLGPVYDEMKAAGVPFAALDRAYLTAITDHQRGRLVAEMVWELGHDPKAIEGLIQAAGRIATSGVGPAPTTPRRNSGKTTRTSRGAKQKLGTPPGRSTGRP
jgi:hypothetical protein